MTSDKAGNVSQARSDLRLPLGIGDGELDALRQFNLRYRQMESFPGAEEYWENRYRSGHCSGPGSRGRLAQFKADVVNQIINDYDVSVVADLGCGDGRQTALLHGYQKYIGFDVSTTALELCRSRVPTDPDTHELLHYRAGSTIVPQGATELALSLDVIFHLVDDTDYSTYMSDLFSLSRHLVLIYAWDEDEESGGPETRWRRFTDDIAAEFPDWSLAGITPNRYPFGVDDHRSSSRCSFYLYERSA